LYIFSLHVIFTLSLHDALPISPGRPTLELDRPGPSHALRPAPPKSAPGAGWRSRLRSDRLSHPGCSTHNTPHPGTNEQNDGSIRSEEHTSELQSRSDLVCRLLL